MAKRPFDLVTAAVGLMVASPILLVASAGIALSSRGPILYRCRRVGRGGRLFTMLKLRTMHVDDAAGPRITGARDPRVFGFGALLRKLKIDELPQLINVLKGDMSIVGPRPEDPAFVAHHYAPEHRETLNVLPGLASPGSIYSSTHGDRILSGDDPEGRYVELLLPLKLALDRVYVRRASFRYDMAIIGRTLGVIAANLVGWRRFANPPEITAAWRLLVPARRHDAATQALLNQATVMRAPLVTAEASSAAPDARATA